MSRRMIDPQMIIKSQVVDDKFEVNLNELLEKYGISDEWGVKIITFQLYEKYAADDNSIQIYVDDGVKGEVFPNTSFTMTKTLAPKRIFIRGLIIDDYSGMNFLPYIMIEDDMFGSLKLISNSEFDLHVIKV